MYKRQIEKGEKLDSVVSDLFPNAVFGVPVVTVVDAHPHSLAWVGGALGSKTIPLGVSDWGQSGNRDELYGEYGTDVQSIVRACISALD